MPRMNIKQVIQVAKDKAGDMRNLPREKLIEHYANQIKIRQKEWTAKGSPITEAELESGLKQEWKGTGWLYQRAGITFDDLLATGKAALLDTSEVIELPKTVQRIVNHIGRNALCPCGSGKKYKKCCGRGV